MTLPRTAGRTHSFSSEPVNCIFSWHLMLTIADLDFFSAVARAQSLAAAARELDVTPSAVTQRLQDLERRVGVRLVDRTARRITLTDEGELLALQGRAITDDVAALTETLAARRGEVAGHLRVIAPFGFGRRYVAPVVAAFQSAHPAITIDLSLSDRLGRVPDSSWDVAVHIGELRETALPAQVLAPNARILCASPEFILRYGEPTTPKSLLDFRCLALRENDEDVTLWRFTVPEGGSIQVRITPSLSSNDGDVMREWGLAGHGIILRSEWSIADDLKAGRLVRLLGHYRPPSADVVALVGPRRGRSARTSRFVQYLRESLSPTPWRS